MTEIALKSLGLKKTYAKKNGPVSVLKGIDLTVRPGESVALTGESGCGKTTLLYLLGLLDSPDDGELEILGRPAGRLSEAKRACMRRDHMGFVYQFHGLLPDLTAVENVLVPFFIEGSVDVDAKIRADALLEHMGVAKRRDHPAGELSGGEQQRVAVARALAKRPPLIFADEPTGNLDDQNADGIMETLLEYCADYGAALICVTHNTRLAAQCKRRYSLAEGLLEEV
ncbi:MAG: ABC transporter ATP-binding protein [Rickettsiales bacterium]